MIDCIEQSPVSGVWGMFRETTNNIYFNTSRQSVTNNNRTVTFKGLPTDGTYTGKLVFELSNGDTVESQQEFEFCKLKYLHHCLELQYAFFSPYHLLFIKATFDLSAVNITVMDGSDVCIAVAYTQGSQALGFIIRVYIEQNTLITRNITRNQTEYCVTVHSSGFYTVRVYDWNNNGHQLSVWVQETNVSIMIVQHSTTAVITNMSGIFESLSIVILFYVRNHKPNTIYISNYSDHIFLLLYY